MNLFELSTLLSPLGGAFGAYLAIYRTVPSAIGWLWLAIPIGLIFGFYFYRCLLRLAVGGYDNISNLPGWRLVAILIVPVAAPYLAGTVTFFLVRTILGVGV